ncbi:WXG100 family type VII secretion target [uncultured Microbacterium sp.]|uniref:WXG100 family type VII secretion target n=1 Tax=uncultured Microbacterium sp. TaxID=191216 RepID=UPI0025FC0DD5|nr:WXG100 family type VII secretion target [uncultured Microbacterium sp.]
MMEHLEVVPARLATTSQSIRAASAQIDALVETLTRETAVLSTMWSGEAQRAYALAQVQLSVFLAGHTTLLARICGELDDLATAYSDADLTGARGLGVSA